MRITERRLRTLIRLQLLNEALIDRLVQKYPGEAPVLLKVSNAGVSNTGLDWYARLLQTSWGDYEEVADVIPTLLAFDKNKNAIAARARAGELYVPNYAYAKYSADINAYENIADIRMMINHLEERQRTKKEKEDIKRSQTTYVYKGPQFNVVMPHTVESSCFWGMETKWCTAATKSQNLFLSYVARNRSDIVLYYIVKKGANPRDDPYAKMSVGYVNGVPQLRGENGGVSVNVKNVGLGVEDLEEELGAEYEPIMTAMNKHAGAIEGKHPAKRQMEDAAKSLDLFKKYTRGMGPEEERDFINQILKGYPVSKELGMHLATHNNQTIRELVTSKAGPDVASWMLKNDKAIWVAASALEHAGDSALLDTYARDPNEFFKRFPKDVSRYENSDVYRSITENPHASISTLQHLMNVWPDAKHYIAEAETSNPELLMSIYKKEPYSGVPEGYGDLSPIYSRFAENSKVPSNILSHMLNTLLKENISPDDGTSQLLRKILRNPMLRYAELRKAAFRVDDGSMFGDILANPGVTSELIQEFWDKRSHLLMKTAWTLLRLAAHKKTPKKILFYLAQSPKFVDTAIKEQAMETLKNRGK